MLEKTNEYSALEKLLSRNEKVLFFSDHSLTFLRVIGKLSGIMNLWGKFWTSRRNEGDLRIELVVRTR